MRVTLIDFIRTMAIFVPLVCGIGFIFDRVIRETRTTVRDLTEYIKENKSSKK